MPNVGPPVSELIDLQHRSLRRQVRRVQGLLSGPFGWEAVKRELEDLILTVRAHFDVEEQALARARAAGKELGDATLFDLAHRDLLNALQSMDRTAAEGANPDALRAMFVEWQAEFHRHEVWESETLVRLNRSGV